MFTAEASIHKKERKHLNNHILPREDKLHLPINKQINFIAAEIIRL